MRSRCRIAHPIGQGRGLLCLHLVERKPDPSSVIAITQSRFDRRVELQGYCGLAGAESRARQTPIRMEKATLHEGKDWRFLRVNRLVAGKRRCSSGRRRCMAKQRQPSGVGPSNLLGHDLTMPPSMHSL
jgi:hypothetical protein